MIKKNSLWSGWSQSGVGMEAKDFLQTSVSWEHKMQVVVLS